MANPTATTAQTQAGRYCPVVPECEFEGCRRQGRLKGLCRTHAAQARFGCALHPYDGMEEPGRMCAFAECIWEAQSKRTEWCEQHRLMERSGEPLRPLRHPRPKGYAKVRDGQGRKQCSKCMEWKPESAFSLSSSAHDGREGRCRRCMRSRQMRDKYKMTCDEYDAFHEAVNGSCGICGTQEDLLCIDHCHKSGEVRGLLCRPCNTTLGFMKDDPRRLRAAAAYVESGGQSWQLRLAGLI